MKILKVYAVLVTIVLAIMVACGGNSKSATGGTTGVTLASKFAAFGSHGFSGMSATTNSKTTAGLLWNTNLIPAAYAQTTSTVTMSGTYHGTCEQPSNSLPPSTFTTLYTPLVGTGTLDGEACRPGSSLRWWGDGSDGGMATAQQSTGEPAIGAGTLSQLVVYGVGNASVSVFVKRAGQTLDTGVKCSIGGASAGSLDPNRCFDTTHTFAVADGDMIVYVLGYTPGYAPRNMTAYISKA